jgi:hypothetical protein
VSVRTLDKFMYKEIILILLLSINSMNVIADTFEFGNFKVSSLRFGQGGVYVTLNPAPKGCGGGSQYGSHFKLPQSNDAYYKDMVSGLLAAYTANLGLSTLWFRNEGTCSNTHILELYMYKYAIK